MILLKLPILFWVNPDEENRDLKTSYPSIPVQSSSDASKIATDKSTSHA
jgi:hypothetical protein